MGASFPVARLGTVALVWTFGFFAVALYFIWRTAQAFSEGRSPDRYDLGVSLLLVTLIVYGWLRSVRRYRLKAGSLLIERWALRSVVLPLDGIKSIEAAPTLGSFFNTGILSIGGLFGWAGRAQVRRTGERQVLDAEVYGTNPANIVLARLNNGQAYVLTPSDPQGLVDAAQEAIPQPVPSQFDARPAQPRPKKSRRR